MIKDSNQPTDLQKCSEVDPAVGSSVKCTEDMLGKHGGVTLREHVCVCSLEVLDSHCQVAMWTVLLLKGHTYSRCMVDIRDIANVSFVVL